jgi:hypothetical protein
LNLDLKLKEKDKELSSLKRKILDLESQLEGNKLSNFVSKLKYNNKNNWNNLMQNGSEIILLAEEKWPSDVISIGQETASFHQSHHLDK